LSRFVVPLSSSDDVHSSARKRLERYPAGMTCSIRSWQQPKHRRRGHSPAPPARAPRPGGGVQGGGSTTTSLRDELSLLLALAVAAALFRSGSQQLFLAVNRIVLNGDVQLSLLL
jgi:hypothetical protein